MKHICLSKLTSISSDSSLSPGRCQDIIWTNAGILLIELFGTKLIEIVIQINLFPLKKMNLNMPSEKRRPFSVVINLWSGVTFNVIITMASLKLKILQIIGPVWGESKGRHRLSLTRGPLVKRFGIFFGWRCHRKSPVSGDNAIKALWTYYDSLKEMSIYIKAICFTYNVRFLSDVSIYSLLFNHIMSYWMHSLWYNRCT